MNTKNKTTDKLKELLHDLQEPGGWDFDDDAAYTRNYMVTEILQELRRREDRENETL